MDKKIKNVKEGLRLNIKKPPKIEVPKNLYNRKKKYKEGLEEQNFKPSFFI